MQLSLAWAMQARGVLVLAPAEAGLSSSPQHPALAAATADGYAAQQGVRGALSMPAGATCELASDTATWQACKDRCTSVRGHGRTAGRVALHAAACPKLLHRPPSPSTCCLPPRPARRCRCMARSWCVYFLAGPAAK